MRACTRDWLSRFMTRRKTSGGRLFCADRSGTETANEKDEVFRVCLFANKQSRKTAETGCMYTGREEKSEMQAIRVENLSKTFRVKRKEKGMRGSVKAIFHPQTEEIRAVNGVSFSVEEGEMLAFIGPNGAGKSTTIKMLTGILYPDGGRVEVLGVDPTKKRRQLAYQIGTVFGQKEQLWTHLTPYDNFRFFGAIYDLTERETEARIGELSERFALKEFIDTPVRNLSLGQRIRCEMVAALIHKPKVLFLDEPTIGLDPVVKENVRELIRQMNREERTTIFLTSHDVGDIEKLCRRIIIVNDGQIVLDDSVEHVKSHYPNEHAADIGTHEREQEAAGSGDSSDVSLEDIIVEIYRSQGEN